jgi:hypothetical protein
MSTRDRERSKKQAIGINRLSNVLRDQLENMLRTLTSEKQVIGECMAFSLDNADSSAEIVIIISQSLCLPETPMHKKVLLN